jgi:hypothetical protein
LFYSHQAMLILPPNLSSIFIYNPPVHASDNVPSFPFPIIWGNTIHIILRRMT